MKLIITPPNSPDVIEIELQDGLEIGRKEGAVLISDPKISSKHARISKEKEKWFILDLGSINKISYQGIKTEKLELFPGVEFLLGNTKAEVASEMEVPKDVHWSERVEEILKRGLSKAPQESKKLLPFKQVLELYAERGPNKGKSYFLAYYPCKVSNRPQDICLEDWNISEESFEILELNSEYKFLTDFPDKVLVNNSSIPSVKLKNGDRILIGETELVFRVRSE